MLITIGAVVVRAVYLDGPIRYDEAFTTWRFATKSLRTIMSDYSLPNNHIFHTVLVHIIYRIGGSEAALVRLPAFLAGVAIVPTAAVVFGRLSNRLAGMLAAVLMAGSSVLIAFSVNARGYSIIGLISIMCLGLATEVRRGYALRWAPVLMGALAAVAFWTIPVFAFAWAGVLLWMAAPASEVRLPVRVRLAVLAGVISVAGGALLYWPVLRQDGIAALTSNQWTQAQSTSSFYNSLPTSLGEFLGFWAFNLPYVVAIVSVVGVVVALLGPWDRRVLWLSWSVVAGIAAILVIQRRLPPTRVWVTVVPLMIGVSASGLASLRALIPERRQLSPKIHAVVACGLAAWLFTAIVMSSELVPDHTDAFPDAETIVLELKPRLGENTLVISSAAPHIRYYFLVNEIPIDPLFMSDEPPTEIYVVVRSTTPTPQTIESVAGRSDIDVTGWMATLIAEYPSGDVWKLVPGT